MNGWSTRALVQWVGIWCGLGLVGLAWVTLTSFDEWISQALYSRSWLLDHAELIERWYRWPKVCSIAAALAVIGFALWGRYPISRGVMPRRVRLYLVIAVISVPLVTWLLREMSASVCPRELTLLGGSAMHRSFLEWSWQGIGTGRCNPSGHMSSFSWWLALCLVKPPQGSRMGILVLAVTLMFALGSVQIIKGAHFLSHLYWSVWWAGGICLLIVYLCLPKARLQVG